MSSVFARSRRFRRAFFLAGLLGSGLLGSGALACDRARAPEPTGEAKTSGTSVAKTAQLSTAGVAADEPARAPTPESKRFVLPDVSHWIAIGDLHGDFSATQQAFRLAGATDEKDRWVGGKLVVVQTGDQLDRGDDERRILDFLDRLEREAEAAGGRLHVLNGNHETMNALGDFRYVTPGAVHAFDDLSPKAAGAERFPAEFRGRAAAFLPGGALALRLSARPVVLQIGATVFAHAGVRAPHVAHGLDRLNDETSAWLRGESELPPRLVQDPEGPLWTRVYAPERLDESACRVLGEALARLGAKHMVVGHNVQEHGVQEACDGRIHRIDVGLSRHYGSGPIQVLEYDSGTFRVRSAPRR